jgi:hypothetical protein
LDELNWSKKMGLVDKLRGTIGDKAKEITDKVAQSYRERLGEDLLKQQEELRALEAQLNLRAENISEREANLRKYYLMPRLYINIAIGLAILVAIYFEYQVLTQGGNSEPSLRSISSIDSTPSSQDTKPVPTDCVTKGIAYYMEIGSYPKLSTGEDARTKVVGMCVRSGGVAFN